MDDLSLAFVQRARSALDMAAQGTSPNARAKAFSELAFGMALGQSPDAGLKALAHHADPLVSKAAASILDGDWSGGDAAALAASYVSTIAETSLLDKVAKFARILPTSGLRVLVAADSVASVVAEGLPKPVLVQGLDLDSIEPIKSAAIVVLSTELAWASGNEGRRLFDFELEHAVNRASNSAVLAAVVDSSATVIAGSGDPLTDLRAGIRAAGSSLGYVVSMPPGDVAILATYQESRSGMGVRGGMFAPGIEIVASFGAVNTTIIPASRIVLRDFGLQVRSAAHASVDMRDTPLSPAQQVSLFQTNCIGLLAERMFAIGGDRSGVVVVTAP